MYKLMLTTLWPTFRNNCSQKLIIDQLIHLKDKCEVVNSLKCKGFGENERTQKTGDFQSRIFFFLSFV